MEGRTNDDHGRTYPIFVAVLAVVAVACGAAWSTMGEAAPAPPPTRVLAARVDAPATSDAAPSTTAVGSAPADPTATSAPATTTTTGPITSTGRFFGLTTSGPVRGSGPVRTYSVEAEDGSGVDPQQLADVVDVVLADARGWTAEGYAFQRVARGGSFTITLATPDTADAICLPLHTAGRFSCHEGHRVVLNLTRWNEGTDDLALDVNDYRAAVVNHEVGHELGLGHVGCDREGLRAPVMMQQSKGLDGCEANPWPTLDGN